MHFLLKKRLQKSLGTKVQRTDCSCARRLKGHMIGAAANVLSWLTVPLGGGKWLPAMEADAGLNLTPCFSFIFLVNLLLLFALTSSQTAVFVWPKLMSTTRSLFCRNLIAVRPNGPLPSFKQALFFSPPAAHQRAWSEGIKACGKWGYGLAGVSE